MTTKEKQVHEKTGVETIETVAYYNIRLQKPFGDNKYKLPADAPALPYLTTPVIEAACSKSKFIIPVLVLVEGSLKALKGAMHGIFAIGINGIYGTRARGKKDLHPIVKKVLENCQVQNLVYLQDADARDANMKYLADAGQRPMNFANAVWAFKKATKELKNRPNCFYAHVKEDIGQKGLDDVLIAQKGNEMEVVEDLFKLREASKYFQIQDLEKDLKNIEDIHDYFKVSNAKQFYNAHSDALGNEPFYFLGDQYKYNDEEDELKMVLPGIVKDYVLVGNRYAKLYFELNSKGLPEPVRDVRTESRIISDFMRQGKTEKQAKELMLQIPDYEAFCNEPDFLNFKQEHVIQGRFKLMNLAYPLEHEPQDGDWSTIRGFLEHIFYNGGNSKLSVGLDMIQMYYTKPKQKQRILALVSRENETGKSTFLSFMRAVFGQNMSIIGATDFRSQFNPYIVKSLVGVDEGKIEDPTIIEAIKSMVTTDYANFNDKMVSARPVINRVKLIMTTNHIFDFANINEDENKWFVLEVGKIKNKNNDLMSEMVREIPAFLHFLRNRKLEHFTTTSRFAIPDEAVETEALARVKENSTPPLVAMIKDYIIDRFQEHNETEILIDRLRLCEALRYREKTDKISAYEVMVSLKRDLNLKPSKTSEHFRYPLPMVDVVENEGEEGLLPSFNVEWKYASGKVYTFKREDFIK
ncbi:DUF5906 domain-containing protein [Rufibacter immobilis]|nr:DUF5906 domain-containing protein [Rufibacter immobilis]